ncbi:Invasion gene expression up-regulator, SirB [Candidatus Paraburkholderia kirkii]|nr:Invasion gene expression up-regulator, SirB [Candidatus Paraburkholderia kirkii]
MLRWIWMLTDSCLLAARPTRILPHIVDTLLLASALTLVAIVGFAANAAWIGAKIAGLVVYIVLGTLALKRGRTKGAQPSTACWRSWCSRSSRRSRARTIRSGSCARWHDQRAHPARSDKIPIFPLAQYRSP